jgi:predicted dehydrogenase
VSALRAGIAGYGLAGEVFHAPLIDAVDGMEVAGVVTTDPERQQRARDRYPSARVVPDIEALWDGIDVLVIATPRTCRWGSGRWTTACRWSWTSRWPRRPTTASG